MRSSTRRVKNIPSRLASLLNWDLYKAAIFPLLSGAVAARVIGLLVVPVLTWLYTPEQYAVFSYAIAAAGIVGPLSTLRLDLAVPLKKEKSEAVELFSVILSIQIVLLVLMSVAYVFISDALFSDRVSLWAVGVVIASALIVPIRMLLVHLQEYAVLGKSMAASTLAQALAQTAAGLLGATFGLLAGYIAGQCAGAIMLLRAVIRQDARPRPPFATRKIIRSNWRFPVLSLPSALINAAGLSAPLFLIGAFYGIEAAGLFALAQRVATLPMTTFGGAAREAFLGRDAAGSGIGTVRDEVRAALPLLLALGVLPTVGLAVAAVPAANWLLTEEWWSVGPLIVALCLPGAAQVAISPLAQILNREDRQDLHLYWDIGRLALVVLAVAAPWEAGLSLQAAVFAYSLAATFAYVVLLVVLVNLRKSSYQEAS